MGCVFEGPEMNNTKRCKFYTSIYLQKNRQLRLSVTDLTRLTHLLSHSLFIESGSVHAVTSWSISP